MNRLMVLAAHILFGPWTQNWTRLRRDCSPYVAFGEADIELTWSSLKCLWPPVDPNSRAPESQTAAMPRLNGDPIARKSLVQTCQLTDTRSAQFAAVRCVCRHEPMYVIVDDAQLIAVIEPLNDSVKPVAVVWHSPAVTQKAKGVPLAKGMPLAFTEQEGLAAHLTKIASSTFDHKLSKRLGAPLRKIPAKWFLVNQHLLGIGPSMLACIAGGWWLCARAMLFHYASCLRIGEVASAMARLALLAGWVTIAVGRQPWTLIYLLRTRHLKSSSLTGEEVALSLFAYIATYIIYTARFDHQLYIVRAGNSCFFQDEMRLRFRA